MLAQYLKAIPSALEAALAQNKKLHVVLGNQGGDLDSVVSALLLAMAKSITYERTRTVFIPALNFPKTDLVLRQDVVHVFERAGLEINCYPSIKDLDLSSLGKKGKVELSLVDHNRLAPDQEELEGYVVDIVDHHKDEGTSKKASRKIEKVGSCCTLVLDCLEAVDPTIPDQSQVALAGLSCVLIDTHNLNSSRVEFSPKDEKWLERLGRKLNLSTDDRINLYKTLLDKRTDVSSLSLPQLMKKDVKFGVVSGLRYSISSCPMHLEEMIEKYDFMEAEKFRKENNLHFVVLMSSAMKDGEFTRQLLVSSDSRERTSSLSEYLQQAKELELVPIKQSLPESSGVFMNAFDQKITKSSRKQVLPIVDNYCRNQSSKV